MSVTSRLGRLPSTFAPLLVGRVLPRVHSALATPAHQKNFVQSVTPKGVIIVRIPYMRFNEFFNRYFTHEEDIFASDPSSRSDEGDLVLVRRMHKPMQKNVEHQVENVLQRLGDVKELVSGRPVCQEEYRDEMSALAALYGPNPEAFDYSTAPARGWQRGRRDFTDRVTYYKWHVFNQKHEDGYSVVS